MCIRDSYEGGAPEERPADAVERARSTNGGALSKERSADVATILCHALERDRNTYDGVPQKPPVLAPVFPAAAGDGMPQKLPIFLSINPGASRGGPGDIQTEVGDAVAADGDADGNDNNVHDGSAGSDGCASPRGRVLANRSANEISTSGKRQRIATRGLSFLFVCCLVCLSALPHSHETLDVVTARPPGKRERKSTWAFSVVSAFVGDQKRDPLNAVQ